MDSKESTRLFHFWVSWGLAGVLGILTLVAGINFIIDPVGIFDTVRIEGFNKEKTQVNGSRRLKSAAFSRGGYDAVILGSSRPLHGLDPNAKEFAGFHTYNFGFGATNFFETYHVFEYAIKDKKVRAVFLALDFVLFNDARNVSGDFVESYFNKGSNLERYTKFLLSIDTLKASIRTVLDNRNGVLGPYYENGFGRRSDREDVDHRLEFDRVLAGFFIDSGKAYANYRYSPERIELYRRLVVKCRDEGIALYAFITPCHARQLEGIDAMGLYEDFERWKRDLVAVHQNEVFKKSSQAEIQLWDFSGYSMITTEMIPEKGHREHSMKWYWDSSHFKKEVGSIALNKVLGSSSGIYPDFGVRLDMVDDIDAYLQSIRIEKLSYSQQFPREVDAVERLVEETAVKRRHGEVTR